MRFFLIILVVSIFSQISDSRVFPNFAMNDTALQNLGEVNDAKATPDNQFIAICTSKGFFFLDRDHYEPVQKVFMEEGVWYCKFSPDGQSVFLAFDNEPVRYAIYNRNNDEMVNLSGASFKWYSGASRTHYDHGAYPDYIDSLIDIPDSKDLSHPNHVTFTSNNDQIIGMGKDDKIVVYDVKSGAEIEKHTLDEVPVSLGFLEDDTTLWVGTMDGRVLFFEYPDFQKNRDDYLLDQNIGEQPIFVSPNGRFIISVHGYAEVGSASSYTTCIYYLHDQINRKKLELLHTVYNSFSQDRFLPSRFLFTEDNQYLHSLLKSNLKYKPMKYDLNDLILIEEGPALEIEEYPVTTILMKIYTYASPFIHSNKFIYKQRKNLLTKEMINGNENFLFYTYDHFRFLSFHPGEPTTLHLRYDDEINIIRIDLSDQKRAFEEDLFYTPFTFSNDGKKRLEVQYSKYVRLVENNIFKIIHEFPWFFSESIYEILFSKDDLKVFLCRQLGWLVWESQTGETLHALNSHEDGVRTGAFSHDATRLLTAGGDGVVLEWNLASEENRTIGTFDGPLSFVAYMDDEDKVLVVNEPGQVFVVKRESGEILYQTQVEYPVTSKDDVALSQDEHYLFVENQILDLDKKTWLEPFGNYELGNTGIAQLRLSPTEEWTAIRTHEGVVRVWDRQHVFGGMSEVKHYQEYELSK
jgi:WD40 repeat protein